MEAVGLVALSIDWGGNVFSSHVHITSDLPTSLFQLWVSALKRSLCFIPGLHIELYPHLVGISLTPLTWVLIYTCCGFDGCCATGACSNKPGYKKRWKLHWGSFCDGPFAFWSNLGNAQVDVLRSHLQNKIFLGVFGICKIYNSLTKLFDTMSQRWVTCLCLAWEKKSTFF